MHTCVLVVGEGDIYELLGRFLFYEVESPPEAIWDYCGLGGVWEGGLRLLKSRQMRLKSGRFSKRRTKRATVAKKGKIDQQALLDDPPLGIFVDDVLYEAPFMLNEKKLAAWRKKFRALFEAVPDDTTLQLVDTHC